ncbi:MULTISPECIES: hypothetical protein [Thermodesulfovibrio]|jgi:hypothetical protein|uniref:hypothetical protein n=1 Tax=Thermodesulfovibrio TaxID=28261 RepID=UPI00262E935C|nr:hypothetical protein [Thermodesulfovibrio sp.]
MTLKKLYGWDKYSEEGIAELKKIKESKILLGKDDVIDLIDRYIEIYRNPAFTNNEITAKDLYYDMEDPEALRDKARHTVNKFRTVLSDFYKDEKGEGLNSEYEIHFVTEKGDYRLGVRKKEPKQENFGSKMQSKLWDSSNLKNFSQKIESNMLNFLRIYLDALLYPDKLSKRASEYGKFKWDTILLFLFTSFLTFIILRHYSVPLKFIFSDPNYIAIVRANVPEFIIHYGIFIIAISSNISSLISFDIIFPILRYLFIFILIPWIIANTIFKEKINLSVFSNFQFYFFLSWIPIYIWLGCAFTVKSLSLQNVLGIYIIFGSLSIIFFINYLKGLWKLLNLNWKKGILFYIIAFILPFLILESL